MQKNYCFHTFPSVADPGCLSRILIFIHPGSRIPDPKTATKERIEKKLVEYPVPFWYTEEKNLAQFSKNYEVFTQKIVTKLSKLWIWDPGSEIRDPGSGKTLSESRIQGSRIRIRNTVFFLITYRRHIICSLKNFNFLLKFCVKILFCKHYFSPLTGSATLS